MNSVFKGSQVQPTILPISKFSPIVKLDKWSVSFPSSHLRALLLMKVED